MLLLAVGLTLATVSASAQTSLYGTNGYTRDTVTNTGNKVLYTLTRPIYKSTSTITVTVTVTKTSGTIAGTIIPVGSNDGTNYYALTGSFTPTDVASQGCAFACTNGYRYYGVKWTGTGTMAGSFVATLNIVNP